MKMKPISTIKANLGIEPNGRVQRFFTDTCRRYMDKFIPKDTGNLRRTWDMGADYITYEQPYAEIQYYGKINGKQIPEDHYTTPRNRTILG